MVGRAEIAEHVWDETFDPFSNLIEVYVNRLRRKIDFGTLEPLLHTRRGAGYFFGLSSGSDSHNTDSERAHSKGNPSARKSHA